MEIRHLKLVDAIAKEGNLSKAAKTLYLTQPALSHQLKEIERNLGIILFNRINKKMIITQAGKKLLSSARLILHEIEKTEREIKSIAEGESGLIRIATECYTSYHWLPKAMIKFNKEFPNVEICIEADATKQPISALLNGKIDLGIVSKIQSESHLIYTKLFNDNLFLVTNKNHRLGNKKEIVPSDLKDQKLLTYTSKDEDLDILIHYLNPANIKPLKIIKIQLTEAIVELVKADVGVTVMAGWAIKPLLKKEGIIAIPFADNKLKRIWYAVVLRNHDHQKHINNFILAIKSTMFIERQ